MKFIILTIVLFLLTPFSWASHIMGGEITWTCQANKYVFSLVLYRDCNQTNTNTAPIDLKVWGHPSVHSVTVEYVQRVDISPSCLQIAGSPTPLLCGSGSNAGNGIGAVEKIVYRSQPIALPGTPSISGWTVTYDDFSRNLSISNLVNPASHGITIAATIFESQNGNCIYESPQFLENPYQILCKGTAYTYNMNSFSKDADSISFSLDKPLDNIVNSYNPPTDPAPLNFVNNYSYTSPTPNISFDSQNQILTLNENTGEITFKSYTTGSFVIKVLITSFKNEIKLSTIQREFQITVADCGTDNNNLPIISSNLPANNIIDVIAGNVVDVDFTIKDSDLLQDGTPQTITVNASGQKFGSNYTSNSTGCGAGPCATLNESVPTNFNNTKNLHFNWETSCNHLLVGNNIQPIKSYTFVVQAKDDYCQIPKATYQTFQVRIHSPINVLPEIACIQPQSNGTYIITLKNINQTATPFFIQDENNNNVLTVNSNTQNTVVVPNGNYQSLHISYNMPCITAGTLVNSQAVKIIPLVLQNPQNGTVLLQWSAPSSNMNDFGNQYYIFQEYPAGTWKIIDSVSTDVTIYRDTLTICKAFINYQIGINKDDCMMLSQIQGDTLQDLIAPSIPSILSVNIDTLTNEVIIKWTPSPEEDTYGYIIYTTNNLGILHEIDTVFGNLDTVFSHQTNTNDGPLTYSIAAFDSCFTHTVPPTFQTSAKSSLHTTIYLKTEYDACSKKAIINWSDYIGWQGQAKYVVYQKINSNWSPIDTVSSNTYEIELDDFDDSTYFVIQGIHPSSAFSFSNIAFVNRLQSALPSFHYTKVATVDNNKVVIKHYIEALPFMTDLIIQKKIKNQFEDIATIPIDSEELEYIDEDVNVDESAYTYRVLYKDSCGNPTNPANEVTTILAKINQVDEDAMTVNLHWSAYSKFDGGVAKYEIYRSINGEYEWPAIYTAANNEFNFEDKLNEESIMDGKVCYYVSGIEGQNIFGFHEESISNEICYVFEPLIYIPNAFTPNGVNPIFNPVINLANFDSYLMRIFDRWNNVIYTTSDINNGWNGIMNNGKKAPFGVYGYQIVIQDGNGKEIRKTGHVTIIWSD